MGMRLMPTGTRRSRIRRTVVVMVTAAALVWSVGASYEVRRGETLSGIALRHGTTVPELVASNDLRDPDHIQVGQRLTLPTTTRAATPADRHEVAALIEDVARANGWSPAFVKALAWQESGWNNARVSSAGAIGIMQVMPGTGDFVARELVRRPLDLTDPRDNVVAGVAFLQYLWELTDGDVERTLAGYYQGLRSVQQHGVYPSTERYIANVLALRERFR